MNSFRKHLVSYRYACNGILLAFRLEFNMWIHAAASFGVLLTNFLLKVSQTEWLFTLLLIGLVWMAEVFNTAIEKLGDRVNPDHDPGIGEVKDLASGAVLLICIIAVIGALVIYLPYLW